MIHYFSISPK